MHVVFPRQRETVDTSSAFVGDLFFVSVTGGSQGVFRNNIAATPNSLKRAFFIFYAVLEFKVDAVSESAVCGHSA